MDDSQHHRRNLIFASPNNKKDQIRKQQCKIDCDYNPIATRTRFCHPLSCPKSVSSIQISSHPRDRVIADQSVPEKGGKMYHVHVVQHIIYGVDTTSFQSNSIESDPHENAFDLHDSNNRKTRPITYYQEKIGITHFIHHVQFRWFVLW